MKTLPQAFLDAPFAHRALHDLSKGRPENSLSACEAALKHGYGIEIDLQLSRDGQAMVFHDYSLERLTDESGDVADHDAVDLQKIGLKGGEDRIPLLSELLQLVAGAVPLLVELKDQHGAMGETDGRLEKATADALLAYEGPVAVMSFNPHMVSRLFDLCPDVPRGLVTCDYNAKDWAFLTENVRQELRGIPDYDRCDASFISHQANDLDRQRVGELKQQGALVLCWTIRSHEQEAEARRYADNVTFEGYLSQLPS